MPRTNPPTCCILSFDYLDVDVFLNVNMFYRLAGYKTITTSDLSICQLVVILRGTPPRKFPEFRGILHIYDYVKEYKVDYRKYFAYASTFFFISLDSVLTSKDYDHYIQRYLPVFPSIWSAGKQLTLKSHPPLHIGNYKPIINDPFQEQLILLSRLNRCRIYGAKWDRINISASPLSYYSANKVLSGSLFCFGLMYPYQRGQSLSGRMWQAPIHGCHVITEPNTNILCCPGVIEVSDYSSISTDLLQDPVQLRNEAIHFWDSQTKALANELHLTLNNELTLFETYRARLFLFRNHLDFLWKARISRSYKQFKTIFKVWIRQALGRPNY